MKKKALVTGIAGFIGSNLARRLVDEGWQVTGVDDLSTGRLSNVNDLATKKSIKLYAGVDFASPIILQAIQSQAFDIVFHLAAIPRVSYSVDNPFITTDVNIGRTIKLLEACRGNIKRFVFASSSSVYGGATVLPTPTSYQKNPKSPYALQKSVCEDFLSMFSTLYGIETVSLRFFNVFGQNQYGDSAYATAISAWCHAIKNGTSLRSDGTGEQSRDMCYVDNVVEANILAAESDRTFCGEQFNVACGDRVSNNEILAYFKEHWPKLTIVNAPARIGDVMHSQADISETVDVLGYTPLVRFWDGLSRTTEWWKI